MTDNIRNRMLLVQLREACKIEMDNMQNLYNRTGTGYIFLQDAKKQYAAACAAIEAWDLENER